MGFDKYGIPPMWAGTDSRYYRFSQTTSKESAMNIKNFNNNTGAENYAAHMARQINSEEESTMNAAESKQGMLKTLSNINPTRSIIGLALGAALLTATIVSLGDQANADSLYKATTI
jgi:hypothetical protein